MLELLKFEGYRKRNASVEDAAKADRPISEKKKEVETEILEYFILPTKCKCVPVSSFLLPIVLPPESIVRGYCFGK